MAISDTETRVNTITQVTYSLDNGNEDHLLRRERVRVKDENAVDFVTVSDITTDVGEKDDWVTHLEDSRGIIIDLRDDTVDKANDDIELLDEQIDEIGVL